MLVVKDAVKTCFRGFLATMKRLVTRDTPIHDDIKPADSRLRKLDEQRFKGSWLGKWRFSSDFRIIGISQNKVLRVVILRFAQLSSPKHACRMAFALALTSFLLLLAPTSATPQTGKVIESIEVKGNRRIPKETVLAHVYTRAGDIYDEASLQRDLRSIWNTGYFEDVRIEREESPKGWRINIYVREKPTIRTIEYHGLNSVSQSDVLERFKKVKVGLSLESPYDPAKVIKAQNVLKDLLSEHGRQFAAITVQVQQIPPAAVAVTFNVKEGPKIKVGNIRFQGNKHVSGRELRRAMKNLHPIGIPQSIYLENLFAKTYDASKLEEDAERVRDAYRQHGYFKVLVEDPKTDLRDKPGGFSPVPPFRKSGGKSMDITIPIEEGERYKLNAINFKNNKAILNTKLLRGLFPIKDGETFDTHKIAKGLENLRKAYGEIGYINFTAVPETQIDDEKRLLTLNVDVDEGKPFFVRRIEFQGNTTTRDRVIRRELLVQEGQVFNSRLWDLSVLRLNQLNYFEQLKPEDDTERKIDEKEGTVDLTVKVKEKGKNSIGLTGGVSGLAGSFIGLNYQTNNFLGLGETLTLEGNVGDRERNVLFGFTEPYVFDRPIQLGFTVYDRKYNFNQVQQLNILNGQKLNLTPAQQNLFQNYSQSSFGFTGSVNYILHSFKRIGITYSWDNSTIKTFSDASGTLFQSLNFRNISGPNALTGIITSKVTPVYGFSTIDNPIRPYRGKSFYVSSDIAGPGGNVNFIRPVVTFTEFKPFYKQNTFGIHLQASFISGWGGEVAPPYERFYMGGENDLRGFDIRTVSPYVFVTSVQNVTLLNPDGSAVPVDPTNPRRGSVTIPVPVSSVTIPGGDTSLLGNFEYRIKLVGPVALVPFADIGMDFAARQSQLKLNSQSLTQLNTTPFGCPTLTNFACSGGSSIPFSGDLKTVPGTNFVPRMSTGLELQVLLPIVQAPFRIYYAYNPLILNTSAPTPNLITRSMFPAGAAGDFTYQSTLAAFAPTFLLKEPKKTFRFTISTTF
jgi:outer membrane protein insertion porin family